MYFDELAAMYWEINYICITLCHNDGSMLREIDPPVEAAHVV